MSYKDTAVAEDKFLDKIRGQMQKAKKSLAICVPGKTWTASFGMSMLALEGFFRDNNIFAYVAHETSADLYLNRDLSVAPNKVVFGQYPRDIRTKKPYNGKLAFDRIFWIDTDMIFDPLQVMKLVDDDEDIVSGMCPKGRDAHGFLQYAMGYFGTTPDGWPYLSDLPDRKVIGSNGDAQVLDSFEAWRKDRGNAKGLVPVDYAGSAFLCVKPAVYEALPYPWYCTTIAEMDSPNQPDPADRILSIECSEDVGFCWRARQAGFQIYADPAVQIGHQTALELKATR